MRALAALLLPLLVVLPTDAGARSAADPRPAFGGTDSPLRPGARYGNGCTFNFVFYDAKLSAGQRPVAYIGTAGHCTKKFGETAELAGAGRVGEVVYDSDLVKSGVDFSLIRLDPGMVRRTNPQMLGWYGPTGSVTAADLQRADVVDLHGQGMVLGNLDQTRSRQGYLVNWSEREYVVDMPAVNGDSGSPLLQDRSGKALGIVSRYGFTATPPSTDEGPLMTYVFEELRKAGFGDVVLATVPART